MTRTSRPRLVVALVGSVALMVTPFVVVARVPSFTERAATVLPPIEGLAPLVEPGPACVPRGTVAPEGSGPVVADGARVASTAVLSCPVAFDGRTITFAGEVIGDVLVRDGGAWVLINDDAYALATGPLPTHRTRSGFNSGLPVWLPDGLHESLSEPGRPGRRGDVVEVVGRVVRVDPDDAGGMTLRAERLRIVAPGVDVDEPLDRPQAALALALLVLAAGAAFLRRAEPRRGAR